MDTGKGNNKKEGSRTTAQPRRKLLKALVTGTGAVTAAKMMPDKWTKPVVGSMLMPAHAQASPSSDPTGNFSSNLLPLASNFGFQAEGLVADNSISEELLEFFLPSAQAMPNCTQNGICNVTFNATVTNTTMHVCVSGDTVGQVSFGVDLNSDPPEGTELPVQCGDDFQVNNASYDSPNWRVNIKRVFSNISHDVALTPGGGCL